MQEGIYIRVKQSLTWLKRNKGILQKDIADDMGMAEASFTRALARIKVKNDEDFVISFHSSVKKYISLDYLLYGTGNMLTSDGMCVEMEKELKDTQDFITSMDDPVKHVGPTSYADKLIGSLENQIKAKDDQLADKNRIIKLLEQKIEVLEAMQHLDKENPLQNYPFKMGVSDAVRDEK